jgi:hypothetical protein
MTTKPSVLITVDIIKADLTQPNELAVVETRLRNDTQIGILINNAGASLSGQFIDQATDDIELLVTLNTTVLVRLASAVAPRLTQTGQGAIINISSAVALMPEFGLSVYGATKAFEAARQAMLPGFAQIQAAPRYLGQR